LLSICDLELEIEAKCKNVKRWRKEIKEVIEDQSRPYIGKVTRKEAKDEDRVDEDGVRLKERDEIMRERRERKRLNGRDEMPWPRDYEGDIIVRERKIELEKRAEEQKPFGNGKRKDIRQIQQKHDFFQALVETISNLQPQTCPVCLDDNVFQVINDQGRGRQGLCSLLRTSYMR
jgi:hypothetical protein